MKIVSIALLASFALAPASAAETAMPSIHYAPRENLERIDTALLATATRTLDVAAYVLTDVPVIDAIADAAGRGVAVRVYRDGGGAGSGAAVEGALARLAAAPGVVIRFKAPGPLMHLKGYVIDGAVLRTGSANFSPSGLKRQDNDLIIITEPDQVKAFQTAFQAMWSR